MFNEVAHALGELLARGARNPALIRALVSELIENAAAGGCAIDLKARKIDLAALALEPAVGSDLQPQAPLVLSARGYLYLQRFYSAERELGGQIARRLQAPTRGVPEAIALNRAQAEVLRHTLSTPLTLVFGGPGTGKTHTVGALLDALAKDPDEPLFVALAAPTGKAAARLREVANAHAYANLNVQALTLHRLLNLTPNQEPLTLEREPLGYDVVVLDECSMVPLGLLAALLARTSPRTRLLLMGDPDQLDAVNEGFAFAELRRLAADTRYTLGASSVTLSEQHRFSPSSALHAFAEATRRGQVDQAMAAIERDPQVLTRHAFNEASAQALLTRALQHFADLASLEPALALTAQSRFQILSARRTGPFSVEAINRAARERLNQHAEHYHGQPLMIERNAQALGLRNGDLGLVLYNADIAELRFYASALEANQGIALNLLPAHRAAYAITIHKSQGSEFDSVAVVLTDSDSAILNRQLIYTAVTRAKRDVQIFASVESLRFGLQSTPKRVSGLEDDFVKLARAALPMLLTSDQLSLPF